MGIHAQRLIAPDGSEMVVLSAADFDRLLEAYEDAEDAVEGMRLLREIEIQGTVPGAVLDAVYDEGITAVLAWRRYRGLSQAELARRAGISQVWLGRNERGMRHGKPRVRAAIAAALDAPQWTLDIGQQEFPNNSRERTPDPAMR